VTLFVVRKNGEEEARMGQRARILTQIVGFRGWKVTDALFEGRGGARVEPVAGYDVPPGCRLVIAVERRWAPRCAKCLAIGGRCHQRLKKRRWKDLPWAGHPVEIEYAPVRVDCKRCGSRAVELLAWADPKQRQTRRFQHHVALDAFSMPLLHVATKYGLGWHTVRKAEHDAIERWERTCPDGPLCQVGVDEKWLGRRHSLPHKFVTIVSDLETGKPLWIGYGRDEATLKTWLDTLTPEQKATIKLFAVDMHQAYKNAVRNDPALAHAVVVHDPFHVIKRAGEAITELRRQIFFRSGPELRAVGRGTRWLVLRAWERTTEEDRARLSAIFRVGNGKLGRAYQVVEELRQALKAPDRDSMAKGINHVLRRTERRNNVPMRKLHDSLEKHYREIVALGEHHPPTGRIEALNNNWETLVRRGRGYRNHQYLLRKLRFITGNPVRNRDGVRRFLALGIPTPDSAPQSRAA
jgi:transposase